jgi:cytochrome c-type biogenesis protein CcmE
MSKSMYVIGILLIAGFAALMVLEMQKASTQYVTSVDDALAAKNRPIQFRGTIAHDKTTYERSTHELRFVLKDDQGKTLEVRYRGPKPANMDTADIAVAIGCIDRGALKADEVLLKCPSKYKGEK